MLTFPDPLPEVTQSCSGHLKAPPGFPAPLTLQAPNLHLVQYLTSSTSALYPPCIPSFSCLSISQA